MTVNKARRDELVSVTALGFRITIVLLQLYLTICTSCT
ncbi:unnamed protein product [Arabidopsis halleri]